MLNRDNLLRRAELLRKQKRFRDAEKELGEVLQQNPEDVEALIVLGNCKLDQRLMNEAITILKQCLQFDGNNDYVFYLIAFAYYQKNENKTAQEYLKEAIALFPYNAGYFALKAHIHLEKKEFKLALEAANSGLEMDAENIACLNARSTALFRMNKKEEAYETINEALSIDPENYGTHANYGWHYLEKGKHREAEKHFREALRINPNYNYAREGYKSALKAKLFFYRWLLMFNLWMLKQNKNIRFGILIGFWLLVRLIYSASENIWVKVIAGVLVGLYVMFAILSWLGSAIANLYLLSTKHGKYILSNSEAWSARLVGLSLLIGMITGGIFFYYDVDYLFVSLVIASFSIPFNEMIFPIRPFKTKGRVFLTHLMLTAGLLSCLAAFANADVAYVLAFVYCIFFIGFIWTGSVKNI